MLDINSAYAGDLTGGKGLGLTRSDENLRVSSAVAFPAVTNDFEGVNLRRLRTAIFGV